MNFGPVTILMGHPAMAAVAFGGLVFAVLIATLMVGDWWEERKQEREIQARAKAGQQQ